MQNYENYDYKHVHHHYHHNMFNNDTMTSSQKQEQSTQIPSTDRERSDVKSTHNSGTINKSEDTTTKPQLEQITSTSLTRTKPNTLPKDLWWNTTDAVVDENSPTSDEIVNTITDPTASNKEHLEPRQSNSISQHISNILPQTHTTSHLHNMCQNQHTNLTNNITHHNMYTSHHPSTSHELEPSPATSGFISAGAQVNNNGQLPTTTHTNFTTTPHGIYPTQQHQIQHQNSFSPQPHHSPTQLAMQQSGNQILTHSNSRYDNSFFNHTHTSNLAVNQTNLSTQTENNKLKSSKYSLKKAGLKFFSNLIKRGSKKHYSSKHSKDLSSNLEQLVHSFAPLNLHDHPTPNQILNMNPICSTPNHPNNNNTHHSNKLSHVSNNLINHNQMQKNYVSQQGINNATCINGNNVTVNQISGHINLIGSLSGENNLSNLHKDRYGNLIDTNFPNINRLNMEPMRSLPLNNKALGQLSRENSYQYLLQKELNNQKKQLSIQHLQNKCDTCQHPPNAIHQHHPSHPNTTLNNYMHPASSNINNNEAISNNPKYHISNGDILNAAAAAANNNNNLSSPHLALTGNLHNRHNSNMNQANLAENENLIIDLQNQITSLQQIPQPKHGFSIPSHPRLTSQSFNLGSKKGNSQKLSKKGNLIAEQINNHITSLRSSKNQLTSTHQTTNLMHLNNLSSLQQAIVTDNINNLTISNKNNLTHTFNHQQHLHTNLEPHFNVRGQKLLTNTSHNKHQKISLVEEGNLKKSKKHDSKTDVKESCQQQKTKRQLEESARPDPVAVFCQNENLKVELEDKDIYQRSIKKVQKWLMNIPEDHLKYGVD